MNFKKILLATMIIAISIGMAGCAKKVTRVASNSVIDLSGKWNDTDSRLVAKEMIEDCLARPWYENSYASKNIIPTIIIGTIKNKSHEHIPVTTFVKDMEKQLTNSGKVEFVANKTERDEIREEVDSQMENASADTRNFRRQEAGADLMMIGTISSIIDQEGKEAVVFYQVDLELINVQTHKKLWIGDKKIKKYIERGKIKM